MVVPCISALHAAEQWPCPAVTEQNNPVTELNDAAAAMRKKAFAMIDGKLQSCLRTIEQDAWWTRGGYGMGR